MRRLALALILMLSTATQAQDSLRFSTFTAAWWNVENLFDTRDDPKTNDDEFTPEGEKHWTRRRLTNKINGIYKTLLMMDLPDVVGLGEVENKFVLRELCQGTPLAKAHYRYVHYDSPDRRGIDCALIYRSDRFRVTASRPFSVSDSAAGFYTRDILVVEGVTAAGDSVCLLLNHWPSKRGGDEAEAHRLDIARTVRSLMLELKEKHPSAAVIAMGDMNSTADEEAVDTGMGFNGDSVSSDGIRNLTLRLPGDWGSHKYQGEWRYIDQVFLLADGHWLVKKLRLVKYDHLLTEEKGTLGFRPKRTHRGPRYEGGISDHLPLLLTLRATTGK
ncbi:MAG: endonuclease [Bacteroidales bacterium]|nr:endonuclease [Bacteroidales bacterium]